MAELKSIFKHQKQYDPNKDNHLFDWKKPFHSKDDVRDLNNLLRKSLHKKTVTLRSNTFPSGYAKANGNPNNKLQRVMFKMTYSSNLDMHKRYIELYMPQIGKDGVDKNSERFGTEIKEYEKHMSPLHFKCIISPESQNIDLEALTKCYVKKLETMTGYEFYWLGCIHRDTDHHHVHLAINGIDKNGKTIHFPKDFIKNTMREMLSKVATDMIGERTYKEIQEAKQNQTKAKRWTNYDEELKKLPEKKYIPSLNSGIVKRLQFLESIKLAKKENDFYTLCPDFEEVLKATGRYNTFLEEYLKPDPIPLHIFAGGNITGKVERVISFDKDESWNDAIIIRNNEGRYYIPIYQLHKENLEGKTVSIENAKGGLNRNVTDKSIKIIRNKYDIER